MSVPFRDIPGSQPVPDVDAIMQGVRARVAGRPARGADTPEDLERVRRIECEIRERTDFGPALADDVVLLHTAMDPLGPHVFTSHRAGLGRLVVAAKQWFRRLFTPVAAVVLVRQSAFNGAVARLLTVVTRGVQSLEVDNDALQRRLDELERRDLELQARCDRLQAGVRDLEARVGTEGRTARPT